MSQVYYAPNEGAPPHYANIGADYYTLGRTPIHNQYQVAANLPHYGFEMAHEDKAGESKGGQVGNGDPSFPLIVICQRPVPRRVVAP